MSVGVLVVASWLVPDKKGISEMPPQAVTLEPLVQGECVVAVLRLLGRTEHAHQPRSATFLWYEISAQGTGPLANITGEILSSRLLYHSKPKSVIQSFG
ncbi:unnamed protein product [Auanema sp. JU1783]|nr:unnamed protein product [Auanema sp. JU1783]